MKYRIIETDNGSYQIQHSYMTKPFWGKAKEKWNDSYIHKESLELSHEEQGKWYCIFYSKACFYNKYYAEWKLFPTKKYDHLHIGCYK